MNFGLKTLMAASVMAAGLVTTAASAMPAAPTVVAPQTLQADVTVDKAAFVCVGRCYRGFGRRPIYRGYRAYRPYGAYRFRRFGYYR